MTYFSGTTFFPRRSDMAQMQTPDGQPTTLQAEDIVVFSLRQKRLWVFRCLGENEARTEIFCMDLHSFIENGVALGKLMLCIAAMSNLGHERGEAVEAGTAGEVFSYVMKEL